MLDELTLEQANVLVWLADIVVAYDNDKDKKKADPNFQKFQQTLKAAKN